MGKNKRKKGFLRNFSIFLPFGMICWVYSAICLGFQKHQKTFLSLVMQEARVGIIMGSSSDFPVMEEAAKFLSTLDVPYEITVVSAHRTPQRMVTYGESAQERGIQLIIAGAGGAAHLPGMIASLTILPVIGVPIKSSNSIDGWDSVLSILQMPNGVPVATVALNAARNAGILAAQILALNDEVLAEKLQDFKNQLKDKVLVMANDVESRK